MSSALHSRRPEICLMVVLLITAGIPGSAVSASAADTTDPSSNEASLHELRTWVAPGSIELPTPSAIGAAKASGNLTRSETITLNDTLVLELRASGLEGVLAARNGSNATARFFDLLANGTAELDVTQRNPSPSFHAKELQLAAYDSTRVVADGANDSYYLVVDLSRVSATRGHGERVHAGDAYRANFSLAESSSLAANGTESTLTNFTVRDPAAELSTVGERHEFAEPAPNQTLRGRTSLPPGSAVTVELRAQDADHRSSETVRVRNDSGGVNRFAATFDFSDVPAGTNFTTDVRAESYPELDFDATSVVVSKPTVRADISTVESTGVSIDATLSHGGFVAVHHGSADGAVLGYSHYLDAGADETAYVGLDPDLESNATLAAVAYRDTDRDGEFDPATDEPYASDGSVVADAVEFTVEETTTADPTTRATTTRPVRDGNKTTADAADTTAPGGDGPVSGFGAVPALVAPLVAGLLARRR